MKKILLGVMLAMAVTGCRAQVRVQTTAQAAPPEPAKVEQPAPPPEAPKAGEQIVLPEQIEFEFDEARIKQTPKTLETLQRLADLMKTHPSITRLRIEGHTDNVGRAKHNDKLSKARAEAVAKWLVQHDVGEGRLATAGFGAMRPTVANDTDAHRAANRRTEYYVEEIDGKRVDAAEVASSKPGTSSGGRTGN
jgi:outer membrane protein OmpA-like peptidoglycan-associated protein